MTKLRTITNELLTIAHNLIHEFHQDMTEQQQFGMATILHRVVMMAEIVAKYDDVTIIENAHIRHDINNLLTPILGYAHLLQSGKLGCLDHQRRDHVDVLLEKAQALKDMLKPITVEPSIILPAYA